MEKTRHDVSSFGLHVLAMAFMLCDHMWATLFPAAEWLTCVGRLAYPIFAFMIAEGYAHTRDLRKYMLRLLFWAAVTEIPFNLMCGGSIFYPFHQNVLWTFLISLLMIILAEKCRAKFKPAVSFLLSAAIAVLGYAAGYASMADYFGEGVLMVLMFYFFRTPNWKNRLLQLICTYILNVELLGGLCYTFTLFGQEFEFPQQGFAILSLIPIWLYSGRQGFHSKAFRYFCYAFYPVHMLLLVGVRSLIL
ncbi:MAG: conjugal transfer protein TraX [Oscillospiraceae bacterium]|nr:conjugal transfer protein TraX [Oscillospiraceae bacterium]